MWIALLGGIDPGLRDTSRGARFIQRCPFHAATNTLPSVPTTRPATCCHEGREGGRSVLPLSGPAGAPSSCSSSVDDRYFHSSQSPPSCAERYPPHAASHLLGPVSGVVLLGVALVAKELGVHLHTRREVSGTVSDCLDAMRRRGGSLRGLRAGRGSAGPSEGTYPLEGLLREALRLLNAVGVRLVRLVLGGMVLRLGHFETCAWERH
mmetsp:Transcript_30832/g.98452  ORF Transcript_30832/g.98452 Transcript_30832/m.98452 type:complete len:208 (-) Transcript_30832:16-639(-)